MFIVTKKPSISFIFLPLSLMCLFLTYSVRCEDIQFSKKVFSFSERAFDIIFRSTFKKAMGLQFCMNLLSLIFFLLA